MSHSSRESNLAQFREALLQLNTQFFFLIEERRNLTVRIQELKEPSGRFSHFDPEREKEVFMILTPEAKKLSLKELLAFSLVMEDQALSMAPGSYPTWSQSIHLSAPARELYTMINPILLKFTHPELFSRLDLTPEFTFLKDF